MPGISISIPTAMIQELFDFAQSNKTTISLVVATALEKYFADSGKHSKKNG